MLNIFYGETPEAVYNTAVYFKNVYEESWIIDPFSRKIIQDIDKSTVLDCGVIENPVFGKLSPLDLSRGVKTLILIANVPKRIFNASLCSDVSNIWRDEEKHAPPGALKKGTGEEIPAGP